MPDDHVPSLSYLVDALTQRVEYAEFQGLDDERRALCQARKAIVDHCLRERRNLSIIETILDRLHIRPAA